MMSEPLRKPQLDLSGLSLVVGLGETGASAARFMAARGGRMRIVDSRVHPPGIDDVAHINAEVITGSIEADQLDGVARIVLSPGLSIDHPICDAARQRDIEIVNDIELFARACESPVIAVTGSNGKSTVVTLLEQMLTAAGADAVAGGNLGPPALDLLEREAELYVLEISSFQLEVAESLAPLAATVLNISADHLDRHADIATYAALKEKLLVNAHTAVINVDDPLVSSMGLRCANRIEFSTQRVLQRGYSLVDDAIAVDGQPLLPLDELTMPGRHNAANALAALALSSTWSDQREPMFTALRRFSGLPHRCEFVALRDDVTWINDSKATNTGATAAALTGLPGPIVLIGGGIAKGADFRELRDAVSGKVHAAILIGEAAAEMSAAIGDLCEVTVAASLGEAVGVAAMQSRSGDTVLLSPACASFDMFSDYQDRGSVFKEAVRELSS